MNLSRGKKPVVDSRRKADAKIVLQIGLQVRVFVALHHRIAFAIRERSKRVGPHCGAYRETNSPVKCKIDNASLELQGTKRPLWLPLLADSAPLSPGVLSAISCLVQWSPIICHSAHRPLLPGPCISKTTNARPPPNARMQVSSRTPHHPKSSFSPPSSSATRASGNQPTCNCQWFPVACVLPLSAPRRSLDRPA